MQTTPSKPYSNTEEFLNALTHGVGFIIAIFGLVYLVLRAEGVLATTSVSIYGSSLILMFFASTAYHSVKHQSMKLKLKLLDHSAIYILIAGTYTPFMLIVLKGWIGLAGAVVIWSIAVFGLIFKWFAGHRFPKMSIALYLTMGWLIILLIYPLYQVLPGGGLWLLLGGGICFSIGVAFYVAKHLRFTHAIWHCFVIAGCACHFMSIYHFVI